MKRLILAAAGLGAVIGMGFYMNRAEMPAVSAAETVAESTPEQTIEYPVALTPDPSLNPVGRGEPGGRREPVKAETASLVPSAATDLQMLFDQAIETLVSSQAGFEQKQAAWKRLKERGKLDQAIIQLEQRATNDPQKAENAAALGQAYLKKAGMIDDVREKAILAMKADQTLEAALSLDSSNWEARYTKAVGMSYWPTQLNKGQEVIEQFQTLIQQQETQAPQPQFARPYAWLGDQYQKAGHADYAALVWQRGAALFPDNQELKNKLASAP